MCVPRLTWFFCAVASLQFFPAASLGASIEISATGKQHRRSLPVFKRHKKLAATKGAAAFRRGFVVCVGPPGREAAVADAVRTVAAIKSVRRAGNNDLVMIFHVAGELPQKEILLLKQYNGVLVRDLKDVLDHDDLDGASNNLNKFRSFDCKVMALLHSPFKQTMLIDSDSLFFQDPASVFDHETTKQTGTLFFYDRHLFDPNPKLLQKDKCKSIIDFAHWADLKTSMLLDFPRKHRDYCKALTMHEQDSSLVAVDRDHPSAAKFLQMLKQFHTKYMLKSSAIQKWSFGDKEFYWISCEFAGIHCGFSPRGRPMHIFFEKKFDAPALVRAEGDQLRQGCSVQVSLMGDGSGLLYANLSDKYCPWDKKLNGVTVWNSAQTAPIMQGNFALRTGRGSRPLTSSELAVTNAYRDDIARLHNL